MFGYTRNLTGNFSNWDTSNVTDMSHLFSNAENFNADISSWDTSNVQNMSYMFSNASSFDQDLSSRNIEGISSSYSMENMFQNAGLSTYNYNAILDSRSKQNVPYTIRNLVVSSSYGGACAGVSNAVEGIAGHDALVAKGWYIVDDGLAQCVENNYDNFTPFITTWETTTADESIRIPTYNSSSIQYDFDIDW
jgi:surface protein